MEDIFVYPSHLSELTLRWERDSIPLFCFPLCPPSAPSLPPRRSLPLSSSSRACIFPSLPCLRPLCYNYSRSFSHVNSHLQSGIFGVANYNPLVLPSPGRPAFSLSLQLPEPCQRSKSEKLLITFSGTKTAGLITRASASTTENLLA